MREAHIGADQHTEALGGGAVPQRTQGAQVRGPCGAHFRFEQKLRIRLTLTARRWCAVCVECHPKTDG